VIRRIWIVARCAWWAALAVRRVRRQLRVRPVYEVRLSQPPAAPERRGERGVRAVLRRLEPSCLERALVLQRWLASRGDPREVVIGVTAPTADFRAHAWLEGESPYEFQEIARVAP
jgi:Transglutaminase-like superfamily